LTQLNGVQSQLCQRQVFDWSNTMLELLWLWHPHCQFDCLEVMICGYITKRLPDKVRCEGILYAANSFLDCSLDCLRCLFRKMKTQFSARHFQSIQCSRWYSIKFWLKSEVNVCIVRLAVGLHIVGLAICLLLVYSK
jgi:hypothetical protein